MANLLAGKYETAATLLRQRILMAPRTDFSRAVLASALGHLGEIEEARRVWRELMEINPQYTFKNHYARHLLQTKMMFVELPMASTEPDYHIDPFALFA